MDVNLSPSSFLPLPRNQLKIVFKKPDQIAPCHQLGKTQRFRKLAWRRNTVLVSLVGVSVGVITDPSLKGPSLLATDKVVLEQKQKRQRESSVAEPTARPPRRAIGLVGGRARHPLPGTRRRRPCSQCSQGDGQPSGSRSSTPPRPGSHTSETRSAYKGHESSHGLQGGVI